MRKIRRKGLLAWSLALVMTAGGVFGWLPETGRVVSAEETELIEEEELVSRNDVDTSLWQKGNVIVYNTLSDKAILENNAEVYVLYEYMEEDDDYIQGSYPGITYDPDTSTLTLDNVKDEGVQIQWFFMGSGNSLTIDVKGDNVIGYIDDMCFDGIELTIKGEGSLTVNPLCTGQYLYGRKLNKEPIYSRAIATYGSIRVEKGTKVCFNGGDGYEDTDLGTNQVGGAALFFYTPEFQKDTLLEYDDDSITVPENIVWKRELETMSKYAEAINIEYDDTSYVYEEFPVTSLCQKQGTSDIYVENMQGYVRLRYDETNDRWLEEDGSLIDGTSEEYEQMTVYDESSFALPETIKCNGKDGYAKAYLKLYEEDVDSKTPYPYNELRYQVYSSINEDDENEYHVLRHIDINRNVNPTIDECFEENDKNYAVMAVIHKEDDGFKWLEISNEHRFELANYTETWNGSGEDMNDEENIKYSNMVKEIKDYLKQNYTIKMTAANTYIARTISDKTLIIRPKDSDWEPPIMPERVMPNKNNKDNGDDDEAETPTTPSTPADPQNPTDMGTNPQAQKGTSATAEVPTTTEASVVSVGDVKTASGTTYTVSSVADGSSGSTNTVTFTAAKRNVKSATIPATVVIDGTKYTVTEIDKNAFKGNKKLTKVTIGKNVTKIGANAFSGCKSLKTITIKATKLKSIGKKAFKNVSSKATIKVPKKSKKAYKKLLKKAGFKGKVK